MKHGLAGFADYEVIELLLTLAIPRSDVKQPAKALMDRFVNLRGILDAPLEALQAVQGIGAVTPGTLAGVLFLGIIATALAMYLWNAAFAILDAGVASLTFFAQPLVGAILGYVFLGERFTPLFFLGGLCIGLGLVIASTEK